MDSLLAVLFLMCLIGLFVGIIKPNWVIFWGDNRTRKAVLKFYGGGAILSFFLFALVVGQSGDKKNDDNTIQIDKPLPVKITKAQIEPINVNIEVSQKMESGRLYISAKTNLPNRTKLMVSLSRGVSYSASSKAIVQNGKFQTEGFTHKGQPLRDGKYKIQVSTPISKLQPDSVKKLIGEKGEYLKGPLITKDSDIFKEDNFVKFQSDFILEGSVKPQDDTPQLLSHLQKFEHHYAKLQNVMKSKKFSGNWSANWNRDLSVLRTNFNNEFGSNIGEYKGECKQGFFNIAVGAGYIFNVWSEYRALSSGRGRRGKPQTLQDMQNYVAEHFEKARKEIEAYKK